MTKFLLGRPKWMTYDPCIPECKDRDCYCPPYNRFGCTSQKEYVAEVEAQKKLLEYQIAECKYEMGKGLVELAETIYRARLIRLESMLKQLLLEEK